MTGGDCAENTPTGAASTAESDDDPVGASVDDHTEVTAALADAGAEILRALVVASDRRARRRHIVTARRLLSIAYGRGPAEKD